MKKLIPSIAAGLLCISGAARADRVHSGSHGITKDHSLRFGVDTEFSAPMGNYADANSVGGGVMVSTEYMLMETLGATVRVGFQMHADRTVGTLNSHVHSIPILLGTRYFIGPERVGIFGAFELGMFDLMQSVQRGTTPATTANDVKFGLGVGLGYQQNQWNIRVNVHSQDVGNFGSAMMITGGIGYQFAGI